jgi:hypothetical protein
VVVVGRKVGTALLASGLLAITLLGGAGGYGVGLWTTTGTAATDGQAAPLSGLKLPPTLSPTPPARKIVQDDSPALRVDDLRYKTRVFTAKMAVKSTVRVQVPALWDFTQPDPPKLGRYTDPTKKRWIRIEAGFTIQRPPAESMAIRINELKAIPANQMVKVLSEEVDQETRNATLVYTYVPDSSVRYVIVRWVADETGNCIFEMGSTGLPQDEDALLAILDRATETATRTDEDI